jgi:hypothetical protein
MRQFTIAAATLSKPLVAIVTPSSAPSVGQPTTERLRRHPSAVGLHAIGDDVGGLDGENRINLRRKHLAPYT